jgi:competence protein ComEC
MVLGEDGDIDPDMRDDFRRAGLAHLVAASGQNIALLCALALPLLMLAGAPQAIRIATLLPLIAIYVALAGSGASILRAGIMAAAGLAAIAAGRGASAVYALLLAATITLLINPRTTGDPGWQLSFAAVAGMLLVGPLVARPLRRLPRFVAEAIGATVAATIATAPLLAHEFGAISLAALPANIAAVPAVAPIMWIGMVEAAIGQLGGQATTIVATVAAPFSELALRWIAFVAQRLADPTWAQARIQLGWGGAAMAYMGIAILVAGVRCAGRIASRPPGAARQPIRARRGPVPEPIRARLGPVPEPIRARLGPAIDWIRALSPSSRRAYVAPLIALALAAAAHAGAPPGPPRHLTVDFIDVGQGDSTLIRDPTGAAVLFDGGVPEARVDRTLKRLGVRRLSVVVATHQSRDHHAGLLQVVKRFPVGLFLDGRDGVRDPSFIALEHEVDRRRISRRPTRAGERLRVGAMTIRILWPPRRTAATPSGDPNQRATVAIVSEGGFDLLLSADAESPVLLPLDLPQVDAMKVPHHGSADPGAPQLLDRLNPRVAVIETGRGNRYGHPRRPTLDALRRRVPRVYRTDRDGTVELTAGDGRIAIRTHR